MIDSLSMLADASLIVTLVNNIPTILAALEAVENTHD